MSRILLAAACAALLSCSGPPQPVALSGSDACAFCRMAVSDKHFAAEVVAPGEEPRFYDDIGCLANDVARHAELARGTAFVADHRTGTWIQARHAVYTRVPDLATPMGSHLIAHLDPPSREADPAAKRGTPTSVADVFGPAGPPGAGRAF